ncbi:MAG TPA: amino acid--tRNA ligase-related protein, partial [Candidatus Saccharimonadales bacterium]|nr:amino acid--tRNA ligase-related protein [Candidatus Saccharimonadales bacterium]
MLSEEVTKAVRLQDTATVGEPVKPPKYDPLTHYVEVSRNEYYKTLISLRHIIKMLCDQYMGSVIGAKNIDLFMLTPSVSSPMGPGSDSEAIAIQFGSLTTFLTDSSQFGFEPIIMNGIDKAYCYLPSMRGEDSDKRHLNQFFHCEIEIKGDLEDVIRIAEEYVKYLCAGIAECKTLVGRMSVNPDKSLAVAAQTAASPSFERITFDDACKLLEDNGYGSFINKTDHGRDISSKGELALMRLLKTSVPIWLTYFDRDRVPFYQKPDPADSSKVLNADLLFPPLVSEGFGGEILGAGQRQDTAEEMYDSLAKQGL